MPEDPLAPARLALDRGEYARCLRLLEPLAEAHPVVTPLGGRARLLMATALMGQGQSERAAACCRGLQTCADPELRSQARDLQFVLDAPVLQRPANWSLTLPPLGAVDSLQGRVKPAASRRTVAAEEEEPPPPPVGPTRSPLGFALVVFALLLLLMGLLGGCLRVDTELHFAGPGRLQLSQTLISRSGQLLPWQRRFAAELENGGLQVSEGPGRQEIAGPVGPPQAVADQLERMVAAAARLTGSDVPPPVLELRERNWLLGVAQRLRLELDLRPLAGRDDLDLRLHLRPLAARNVRLAVPHAAGPEAGGTLWTLEPGALNRLEAVAWRWSRVGLGGLAILLLLLLSLVLQRLRRLAGFGWPELPAP